MEEYMNEYKEELAKDELIKKYKKVYQVDAVISPDDDDEFEKTFYFQKPPVQSLNRYLKNLSKDSLNASNRFVKDSIVEEQADELNDFLEKYPVLGLGISEKLLNVLGMPKEINFKKL